VPLRAGTEAARSPRRLRGSRRPRDARAPVRCPPTAEHKPSPPWR
jgi:hypothetical protein